MARHTFPWQGAFIIGLVIGIVVVAAVHGASMVTAVTGIVAVIVALLNALTAASRESIETGGTLGAWARRALNITPILKVSTVGVWIANAIVVTLWGVHAHRQAQQIAIKGSIVRNSGLLARNAEVSLLLNGTEMTTVTPTGQFTFDHVNRGTADHALLRAKWQSADGEKLVGETSVLLTDAAAREHVQLMLPPGRPPFIVSYLTVQGYAVDMLVRGQLPAKWVGRSPGRTYVVRTPIFDRLERWSKRYYGEPVSEVLDAQRRSSGRPDQEPTELRPEELPRDVYRKRYMVLTIPPVGADSELEKSIKADELKARLVAAAPWIIRGSPTTAHRYATRDMLSFVARGTSRALLRELSAETLPPDFALVGATYDPCALSYKFHLLTRLIQTRVAVFEATEPLALSQFRTRSSEGKGLRLPSVVDKELAAAPATDRDWFPQTLRKGDVVAIPLDIELAAPKDDWHDTFPADEELSEPLGELRFSS